MLPVRHRDAEIVANARSTSHRHHQVQPRCGASFSLIHNAGFFPSATSSRQTRHLHTSKVSKRLGSFKVNVVWWGRCSQPAHRIVGTFLQQSTFTFGIETPVKSRMPEARPSIS
jgi:hypothetical protein